MKPKETVFVGMSGGVDSSVAALRLKKQGYKVVGVFITVWQPDFLNCNWEQERLDAMRVAAHLEIPFLTCDAVDTYKQEVADYMISEYKAGRTPNPDVVCNQHVKFGAFLDFAKKHGADKVATGHYARLEIQNDTMVLLRGRDANKDQSYFLWTLTETQRAHILFPVGDTPKDQIRQEAHAAGLPTAAKKDSQGICFLGAIDMKGFLQHYVRAEPGNVLDENGLVIGTHDGALFYTTGQRHGFTITAGSNGSPQYVVKKNLETNTLTVSVNAPKINSTTLTVHSINEIVQLEQNIEYDTQFRYRQKTFKTSLTKRTDACAMLSVLEETDTPSEGQSCVFYKGDVCAGGGIISYTAC